MSTSAPLLSVIMPAYNGTAVLPRSLEALLASDLPRVLWELIVVDDASTDTTAQVAARYADVVVRLPGRPHGPAYARNRGVEAARGAVVLFIDADVCVHADTLSRFAWIFAHEPEVGGVFGSYDSNPPAPGLVSQYRNLMHHYVHHQHAGEAETFWAGCGGIRTDIFYEAGKFDEWHFPRPQIEDIELGHRIRALGHRILLRPEIQCTHLKHWTLSNVIITDVRERGIPWMRLLLTERRTTSMTSLNLKTIEKLNTALVGFAVLAVLIAAWRGEPRWLAGLLGIIVPLVSNRSLYGFYYRQRGLWFMLGVVPLHLMYYLLNVCSAVLGYLLHHIVGVPGPSPEVQALAEVGVRTWPPIPAKAKGSGWLRWG